MKAVVVPRFGPAEVLVCEDAPDPVPGPGEVLIRQSFAGVNYADIYQRNGLYRSGHTYGVEPPFVPGFEGIGRVEALGEGCRRFRLGQRVGYCLGRGGYAELVVVQEDKAVAVPDDCADDVAAALMLQGATAHYLTHSLYPLGPEDTCLVHAAAGGVGRLLVQIAKAKGARVIAAVGTPEKASEIEALGADRVLIYGRDDLAAVVREITGGRGVDVVYDGVGRATISQSLRCLRVRGTCALFGAASGPVDAVSPMDLAEAGSVFFTRPHLAHYRRDADEADMRATDIFELYRRGRLSVAIDSCVPLERAAEAHRRLESRASRGKILLDLMKGDQAA
jgi:NADPH2:quinone reductase